MSQEFDQGDDLTQLNFQSITPRLGAWFLDFLFIGLPVAVVQFYNLMYVRDYWLWLVVSLIAIIYKPLLEGCYGATWGKKILRIKVVDYVGERINVFQAVLRSIFTIALTLLSIPVYYVVFHDSYLLDMDNIFTFSKELAIRYEITNLLSSAGFFILSVESMFLITDRPYYRALHDRIAKTYVVEKM